MMLCCTLRRTLRLNVSRFAEGLQRLESSYPLAKDIIVVLRSDEQDLMIPPMVRRDNVHVKDMKSEESSVRHDSTGNYLK